MTLRERGPGEGCALDLSAFRCCVEDSSCRFRFFSVKPAIFVLLLVQFLGLRVQFVDDPRGNGGDGSAGLGAAGCPGVPELFFCRPAVSMGDPLKRLHSLTACRRHRMTQATGTELRYRWMSLSGNFNELEPWKGGVAQASRSSCLSPEKCSWRRTVLAILTRKKFMSRMQLLPEFCEPSQTPKRDLGQP